jgi:hypothetical protein
MKLVTLGVPARIPSKKKNSVRIDISDDLFKPGSDPRSRAADILEREARNELAVRLNSETILVGVAALSGLIIGYYLGRKRS